MAHVVSPDGLVHRGRLVSQVFLDVTDNPVDKVHKGLKDSLDSPVDKAHKGHKVSLVRILPSFSDTHSVPVGRVDIGVQKHCRAAKG